MHEMSDVNRSNRIPPFVGFSIEMYVFCGISVDTVASISPHSSTAFCEQAYTEPSTPTSNRSSWFYLAYVESVIRLEKFTGFSGEKKYCVECPSTHVFSQQFSSSLSPPIVSPVPIFVNCERCKHEAYKRENAVNYPQCLTAIAF